MTALCAWVQDDGTAGEAVALADTIAGRYGPDRRKIWRGHGVAIGVWQHQTLPEDYFDETPDPFDGAVIAADIRLDNRDELAEELSVSHAERRMLADSAIVQRGFKRWGVDVLTQVVGEFAIIAWFAQTRTLVAARDPLGVRPLCYTQVGRRVGVASMPACLLASRSVSHELDDVKLAQRLLIGYEDRSRTFFRDVRAVPPGHFLRVEDGRVELVPYARLPQGRVRFRRDDDYVERFRELYDEAVRCRLRAIGPVASMLSSGLDSGSVTALAARQLLSLNAPLTAITWRPQPGAYVPPAPGSITDESAGAADLAARFPNVRHLLVEGSSRSPLEATAALSDATNEPFRNVMNAPLYVATGDAVRHTGARVLLNGHYGNYSVSYSGGGFSLRNLRRGSWLRTVSEGLAFVRRSGLQAIPGAAGAFLPARLRLRPAQSAPHTLINPSFRQNAGSAALRHENQRHAAMWRWPLARLVDVAPVYKGLQAVLGLEPRDPTMDIRLIAYCASIPEDQYARFGEKRWLIRRAMRNVMPDATLDQRHRGLQAADWPRFVTPFVGEFLTELDALDLCPLAGRALDLANTRATLAAWPPNWSQGLDSWYAHRLIFALTAGAFILRCEANRGGTRARGEES